MLKEAFRIFPDTVYLVDSLAAEVQRALPEFDATEDSVRQLIESLAAHFAGVGQPSVYSALVESVMSWPSRQLGKLSIAITGIHYKPETILRDFAHYHLHGTPEEFFVSFPLMLGDHDYPETYSAALSQITAMDWAPWRRHLFSATGLLT